MSTKRYIFILVLFLIAVLMTAWSINENYKSLSTIEGLSVLTNWSYGKMSIQITLLTLFAGNSMGLRRKVMDTEGLNKELSIGMMAAFYFIASMILPILFIPGATQLGLVYDPAFRSASYTIVIIQTCYFYLVAKMAYGTKTEWQFYAIAMLICVAVIYTSPILNREM